MSNIPIRVDKLGKKYVLRHAAARGYKNYTALRDVLTEAALSPLRKLKGGSNAPSATAEEFWALRDVSFEIKQGESVGIIGRNGAGKSTLLKLLSRITEPTAGRIELEGKVASLLEVGTGFHPELTGHENIFLNGAILGMRRAEIKAKFDEIVTFAEVEKFLDTPVKRYSSGMYVRLAFAVAAHLEPEGLIVDEVLSVGDAEFQKKCLGKMQSATEQEGRTVLFVSHNMQAVRQMCQRVIFLKQGKIAFEGDSHTGISAYLGQGGQASSHATIDLTDYPRTRVPDGAVLRQARFLDADNRPAVSLHLHDTLTIEADVALDKRIKDFNLSMAVVHGEGTRVFSEAYSDEHPMPDLEPGLYTIRFHVPMRFFKMESYFLSLTTAERGRLCDSLHGLLLPEIIDENPNLQMESQRWGIMRVPVTWDPIKPAVSATAGKEK